MVATNEYFSVDDLFNDCLIPWHNYWDKRKSLPENNINLLKRLIYYSDSFDFYPLITAYIFTPTRACRCLPILTLTGQSGSGKSSLIGYIKELRNVEIHTSLCTFASLRNSIDNHRYFDRNDPRFEREGTILLWDNLRINNLTTNPDLYQLLLLGYSFRTAKMSVAKTGGKNMDFNTFCPKVLSTIDNFHVYPEFSELYRRLWVIPHKKFENNIFCDIKIDAVNWSGFSRNYYDFWDRKNITQFIAYRQNLISQNIKDLPNDVYELCVDIISTGLTLRLWQSESKAIEYLSNYYQWFHNDVLNKTSNLDMLLKIFLDNEYEPTIGIINPKLLKNYITNSSNRGLIDNVKFSQIQQSMSSLGFKLSTKGWIKNE